MGERLRQLLIAKPFQPFTVKIRGGKSYQVSRCAEAAVSPSLSLFYIADIEDMPFVSFRMDQIESVEVIERVPAQ